MLPGAALGSLAARFCWQGQHFRLWTVPERVSGPCQAQHLGASRLVSAGRAEPGGSLGSLAARFCWQGQHFRLWTVPERVSGPPPLMLPGAALGSLGSGRCPSAFRPGAALGSLAARFWHRHTHTHTHTHTRHTHVGALRSRCPSGSLTRQTHSRRTHVHTWEPRGSFLLAGAALQALDGPERVSGPPPLMLPGAALGSLAARFCWQGQHFRLWTVPERVSGPPPLMLPGAALGSLAARFCWQGQHFRLWTVPERFRGLPWLVSAGRGSTSGSKRYPSAFRGPPLP